MAQDVGRDLLDVLGERVVTAAHERERTAGQDHVDRRARARTEDDEALQLAEPDLRDAPRGVGELHRVLDQGRVDEDGVGRPLQRGQLRRRRARAPPPRARPVMRSTITNSSVGVG